MKVASVDYSEELENSVPDFEMMFDKMDCVASVLTTVFLKALSGVLPNDSLEYSVLVKLAVCMMIIIILHYFIPVCVGLIVNLQCESKNNICSFFCGVYRC